MSLVESACARTRVHTHIHFSSAVLKIIIGLTAVCLYVQPLSLASTPAPSESLQKKPPNPYRHCTKRRGKERRALCPNDRQRMLAQSQPGPPLSCPICQELKLQQSDQPHLLIAHSGSMSIRAVRQGSRCSMTHLLQLRLPQVGLCGRCSRHHQAGLPCGRREGAPLLLILQP